MASPSFSSSSSVESIVSLPHSVESMLRKICSDQMQQPPDAVVRQHLARIGEDQALDILRTISATKITRSLSGFIMYFVKQRSRAPTEESNNRSPQQLQRSGSECSSYSSPVKSPNGYNYHSPISKSPIYSPSPSSSRDKAVSNRVPTEECTNQSPQHKRSGSECSYSSPIKSPNDYSSYSPISRSHIYSPAPSLSRENSPRVTPHELALSELEFRKSFLILSYLGRNKLEDFISVDGIRELQTLSMIQFETKVWNTFGHRCGAESDRRKYSDWDSEKTYIYHCHVHQDGSYIFKGPYLNTTRTHLQRVLGDDNVLVVKFSEEEACFSRSTPSDYAIRYRKIAENGILVGLRCYRFFVFKDGGKEEKKRSPTSSSVKCYFVRFESFAPCDENEDYILSKKTISEARCLFMHVHMVSSLAKYMARFSLILSKTIRLRVNLATVHIETIEDIPCFNENGHRVYKDGEPLIHTDGTGYISEDLALTTPKDFSKAKYISNQNFERYLDDFNNVEESSDPRGLEVTQGPPLLMQVRLFNKGCAVKGTLLVNRKLPPRTIHVRPSMIKVETDAKLQGVETRNSLEVVGISNKPRRTYLSKNLIALLNYGGVPKEYFKDLVTSCLEDIDAVYSNKRVALRVALNHGEIDDDYNVARMILSGVPLNEPFLQFRLSMLAKEERKALQGGKVPISESYYLMGTVDPTGELKSNEVCVILDNGQVSKDVLVYRNPGLHFGDIHQLKAIHVKALEDYVGNAKYAIFFSTEGRRSVAAEIANGDFDGDMYWVSHNPQLLKYFKVSKPWDRLYSTPNGPSVKPSELSDEELEHRLFQLFMTTRFQRSSVMGVAADSWMAFMDRLLTLGNDCSVEKDCMRERMHKLVDRYYDALDAPKTGKQVVVEEDLRATLFPHYMERPNSYHSTSVLGCIYDLVKSFKSEDVAAADYWRKLWGQRYDKYRSDMTEALKSDPETMNDKADEVIKRYKQMLYEADEFEESRKNEEDLYIEALAIYHASYNHAMKVRDVRKCRFAWKVAGPVLCKFYASKQKDRNERLIACSPSILREVLN